MWLGCGLDPDLCPSPVTPSHSGYQSMAWKAQPSPLVCPPRHLHLLPPRARATPASSCLGQVRPCLRAWALATPAVWNPRPLICTQLAKLCSGFCSNASFSEGAPLPALSKPQSSGSCFAFIYLHGTCCVLGILLSQEELICFIMLLLCNFVSILFVLSAPLTLPCYPLCGT